MLIPKKKKPGRPALPDGAQLAPSTARTRATRARQAQRKIATEIAAEALTMSLGVITKDLSKDTLDLAQRNTSKALRLILEKAPEIIENLSERAKSDTASAALLLRYMLPPASRVVKFKVADTADLTSYGVVTAAAKGEISVEDANAALGLLERAAETSLAGALAHRLRDLSEQVQKLKLLRSDTQKSESYKTLTLEEVLEQRS